MTSLFSTATSVADGIPPVATSPAAVEQILHQSNSTSAAGGVTDYLDFLRSKMPVAEICGFEPLSPCHPSLLPHQRDICLWAIRGGRRAVFASFGLGKTRMHIQIALWVVEYTGGRFLIVAPLGVRMEFINNDGPAMGAEIVYVRNQADIDATDARILITNYERVRDGDVDVTQFAGAGLDESSVLRSYGSKTFQSFLTIFKAVPFRWVFTATPSPNRYKELIHYGAYLGIMDSGEALTRFFQRDSSKAGNLTLYPHMEKQFWHWLASWACFIQKPSDLGYSDEGYDLPGMEIHWHRLEVDHTQAFGMLDDKGQAQLLLDRAKGLAESAATKRNSIQLRVEKARELIGQRFHAPEPSDIREAVIDRALNSVENQHVLHALKIGVKWGDAFGIMGSSYPCYWDGNAKGIIAKPDDGTTLKITPKEIMARVEQWTLKHWLLWHDLEDERKEIQRSIPEAKTVWGSQDIDERENLISGFANGEFSILATKPSIAGSGCNFQRHCADAIFLGVGYKFNDLIQAIHRIARFQQKRKVHIHIIYLASEDAIVEELQAKWRRHTELMATMTALLQKFRLSTHTDMELLRSLTIGDERAEVVSDRFKLVHNDCVLETQQIEENSVDLICTSIPFGNQYEYSPSFNDFGHNPGDDGFFQQMAYLCPQLLRITRPGRIAAIHVKDRIEFGNVTGHGCPTVNPFSDKTVSAFKDAGWLFMARITIDTDVVRENAQTYRLSWSENAKDGTKMGAGMPEYVLIFRKPPSDGSNAYADVPVVKPKEGYTRADWQMDAAGLWRSNGNRLPDPDILKHMPVRDIKRIWERYCLEGGYSHEEHVELAKKLEEIGKLPGSFMLFPPVSRNADVWTDIQRINTLNSDQARRNVEKHVCPLQLDIIKRLINRYTNKGEIVFDPFAGIGSVPYQAVTMGRHGWGSELNADYWKNSIHYCERAEAELTVPTLFDLDAACGGERGAA